MRIYTRTGDDGTTRTLGGNARVSKAHPQVECCGQIDELNSWLGFAATAISNEPLAAALRREQNHLFAIGAHLAMADDIPQPAGVPALAQSMVDRLETEIDAAEQTLPPLHQFILPTGHETAARLHIARTVCRRAERRAVQLAAQSPVPLIILAYLNRLGDWLFTHARLANHLAGQADLPWQK